MQQLKALEYLKEERNLLSNAISYNEQNGAPTNHLKINLSKINEAINELEQYEQNYKQREFDYRTKCQNIVSAARLEADDIANGGYIDSKKSTEDINQMIEKLEEQSTFYKLVGYESDGRE